jgi:hypothetical protein
MGLNQRLCIFSLTGRFGKWQMTRSEPPPLARGLTNRPPLLTHKGCFAWVDLRLANFAEPGRAVP